MKHGALLVVVLGLVMSSGADAKRRRKKAAPAPAAKETTLPAAPSASPAGDLDSRTPEDILKEAQTLYDQLEYDRVIPLAKAVIGRPGVPLETKIDAYILQGSALAIIDPIDAETPFRLLLEYRRDFDMPPETPPKILAVFRKVQVEVDYIHKIEDERLRKETIADLQLKGEHPGDTEGGLPVIFAYGLKDKKGSVDTVSVQYRKGGEKSFSSLALKQSDDGRWKGAIPGDFTANDSGFNLEFYIVTQDDIGELLVVGTEAEPLSLSVSAGEKTVAFIPPVPVWGFASGAVAAGALTGLWGVIAVAWGVAQADYLMYANRDLQPFELYSGVIEGNELNAKARNGWIIAISANVTAVLAAVAWGAVAATGIWLTNWDDEQEPEY